MTRFSLALVLSMSVAGWLCADDTPAPSPPVSGWLAWRGPTQMGTSDAKLTVTDWSDPRKLTAWEVDLPGRGAAVVARYVDGDRLYVGGYRGEREKLVEVLAAVDPTTGRVLWEKQFPDFLSDIIYNRYSIGSTSIDPETGNVYWLSSPGILVCFDRDGREQWRVSMMEMYGRLTFPNGRTGSPTVFEDLVIVNAITSNWGREGPAKNRLYAFDKYSGELVWSCDPGVGPPFLKDSSFSTPLFDRRGGVDVFYVGLGDGNVVCANARTGEPIWRWQMCVGGVNSSAVIWKGTEDQPDRLVIVHGQENVTDTGRGFAAAIDLEKAWVDWEAARKAEKFTPPIVLKDEEHVLWRNDGLSMFTSSPTLVGNRVFQLTESGYLVCLDAQSGKTLWSKPLGSTALHGSPLFTDGILFVPIWQGGFYVIRPSDTDGEILAHWQLDGECIGTPTLWDGKLYVHTTAKLYAFNVGAAGSATVALQQPLTDAGPATQILVRPAEVLLRPGERAAFELAGADEHGMPAPLRTRDLPRWEKFVPPTALVKAELDVIFEPPNHALASSDARYSAGAIRVTQGSLHGFTRGRILPAPPYSEDFESFTLSEARKDTGVKFAYPPLPWIGARLKWDVQEIDGSKVLAKTLDNILFMRAMVFIGHPDDANYTVAADVMTDGNRRNMSCVGVINQRYIVALDGNKQAIEISSNHERVKIETPFKIEPKVWYRLETRVDVQANGSGLVKARVWKRGESRPEDWTLTATVPVAHTQGSPGLYGFSPQSRFSVYIDNVEVKANE